MAANTNLVTDKVTNNWFKASIALNVTKQGLTNFLEKELQNIQAVVGRSCGNCPIEKLLHCPTNPYCNKRNSNNCPFHKSQKPLPCPTCDNVKKNIISQHRYGRPSWRNTRAEKWSLDYWEIGKCYLPPDGYSSVTSVQESDFNGVISIMLNCFNVRQIGRDVRHTADCTVTDADLKDYFQTLFTLLTDPICLQQDPSATTACTRLRDLLNDNMSMEDLRELLKEAYAAGERFSEEAERTLEKVLENKTHIGEVHIENKTQLGEERIEGKTKHGEQLIGSKTHDAEQFLESKTQRGEERIEGKITHAEQLIEMKTHDAEQYIESKTQHGEERIESKAQLAEQCIQSKTHDAEKCLHSKIQDGTQLIEQSVHEGVMRIKQETNETANIDYDRGKEDLRSRLMEHYNDNSSYVPLSVLDKSLDKRITDIYAMPKIHRIEIENAGKRVKKEQVLTYAELFYTKNSKSNPRVYVQGEPGSGKSTFAAKLVHDWCDGNRPSTADPNVNAAFDDVLIIQNFQFIFFISLRESRGQTDVIQMIKKQLIDTMYLEEKRHVIYKLLLHIIETELCLVVRDGLDEWVAPEGSNLAEPSMAGFPKDRCTVLTTARPWKLADERIRNSQIDILVEIEGINDPDAFSERVLWCILDESKDLETTKEEFESFISKRKLTSLSHSPMLYTLVICTWVETMEEQEHLKGSSLCALYTTLLESLCKKANATTGFFNDIHPPHVKCFSSTNYLRPIIQNVDAISKAAFHLLFSPEKETSIVFNDRKLSNYLSESEKEFALKAGLISKRKTGKASISFIHKSMQEFLAAFHIACNAHLIAHLIDDVISRYLTRHKDAYLDISQVFIFLCGLNISAANKLSGMMDEHNAKWMDERLRKGYGSYGFKPFQDIIEAGYREAVSNEQTGILLRLSHIDVSHRYENNLRDIYNIWTDNTTNVMALDISTMNSDIHSSPAHNQPTSHVEFNLSTCLKLKSLKLWGSGIRLQESGSSMSSAFPIWIVLNSADQAQCEDPHPVLPCIEDITLHNVTWSSTCLRSLFSILLTLDHKIKCELKHCTITPCIEDAVRGSDTKTDAQLECFKNTSNMLDIENDSPGLWEALHGLNIKSLGVGITFEYLWGGFKLNHAASMSQSLPSLAHLETLSIYSCSDSPGLWEALRGLNIKRLSLRGGNGGWNMSHPESLSRALSSLKHLATLSIKVNYYSPRLLKALHGLNIKSLSLSDEFHVLHVDKAESMWRSLSSLTKLETLTIKVNDDSPGLWKALHGLNIKSLSLSGGLYGFHVNDAESLSRSLLSLKQLETLSIYIEKYIDLQLPQLLKCLHIYCRTLLPSELRKLVNTLSACTRTVESKLEFGCTSFEMYLFTRIHPEEYMPIKLELETLKNVAVKRFRILDRIRATKTYFDDDAWSARAIGGVDDDNQDDDNVEEDAFKHFVIGMSRFKNIINRMSIRLLITPASNS